MGPRGVTPRAIAQFLGAWEARRKEGISDFGLHPLVHREFPRVNSSYPNFDLGLGITLGDLNFGYPILTLVFIIYDKKQESKVQGYLSRLSINF